MAATGMLREYGAAIRGDWSMIDDREVRFALDEVADWIDHPGTYPGDQIVRGHLDLCPRRHWALDGTLRAGLFWPRIDDTITPTRGWRTCPSRKPGPPAATTTLSRR